MAADDGTPRSATAGSATAGRAVRLAIIGFTNQRYDSRTRRIARSARRAGYEVVVYARWEPGLGHDAVEDGIRVVRVAVPARALSFWPTSRLLFRVPSLRRRRRTSAAGASAAATSRPRAKTVPVPGMADGEAADDRGHGRAAAVRRWLRFPHQVLPWAAALDRVVEPADLWLARSSGGLPAAVRQQRRLGGVAVYDSGEVYVRARELASSGLYARLIGAAERRWAHRCAAVITNTDGYADLLQQQLRMPRPLVVMNCSERAQVQDEPADLIRTRLDLPAGTRIVLYQGIVLSERGIEESMDAILELPDAVLVVMGNGPHRHRIAARAAESRYGGRVQLIDAVPPAELIRWTSSADVMVIAIPATSDNHRYAIPNKLFEAMAAGVPVVASDLPGMAPIIREVGAGVLCDPRSPASIAAGLRTLLDEPPAQAAERRSRILEAARTRYAWETQEARLLELWRRLLA